MGRNPYLPKNLMGGAVADELDLLRGTLDLLVLRTLVPGPLHGYAVAAAIRDRSDGALLVEEGALYPALHRLEGRGLVEAEWGVSENNRKARYYALTPAGVRRLRTATSEWDRYVQAVSRVLAPTGGS
jgi:PadR family transcriptional regulator